MQASHTAPVTITAFAGSLRTASWTRALLGAAARRAPADAVLSVWTGLESVPPFNEDRETDPAHPGVAGLRAAIGGADALRIVSPEYNGSFPGILKNALDWASRPYGTSVLQRVPIAVMAASQLPTGGASALADLKRVLTRVQADLIEAELAVPFVHTRFGADGGLADPDVAGQLDVLLARIVTHVRRGATVAADTVAADTVAADTVLADA